MRRIRFTSATIHDLEEIYNYIAADNIAAAQRLAKRLRQRWHALADNPGIGRKRDDLQKNIRSSTEGNYVTFYRPLNPGIEIVRVFHTSRDIEKLFHAE